MDDLEKRRRLLADPDGHLQSLQDVPVNSLTAEQLAEIKSSQAFEKKLKQAMEISVPADLVDQIILKQRLSTRTGRFVRWSMAASFLMASLLGLMMLNQPVRPLSQTALAHVYHELDLLANQTTISPEIVSGELAKLDIALPFLPEKITFAYPCGLDGEDAMHMIAQVEGKPVTLILTRLPFADTGGFGDGRFVGKFRQINRNGLITIAEEPRLIDQLYQQLAGPQVEAIASL